MLAQIRAFAKSPVASVLLGLLVVSFAVFGITDVFKNHSIKDAVVEAGSRSIGSNEFKSMFQNYLKQLEQRNGGQPVSLQQAADAGADKGMADNLAGQEAFYALLTKMGIKPSDEQVRDEIAKNQAFFDPITGKFDPAAYKTRLEGAGLTIDAYESGLRDQIAETELVSGLAAGLTVPRTYLASVASYNREARDFTWFQLNPGLAGTPVKPTDAQLLQYMKENAARFTKPELRQLSYVRFSAAEMSKNLPVNEADVLKRFNFEKETLSVPDTRTLTQIPVKDAATGAQVADRLRKGEAPDAVAKAIGVNPIIYSDAPKSAISDRKIADAAFVATVKDGDVLGPVPGALGMAVLKITKATTGHQATLDEARQKIEAEVRKDAATDLVYKTVQKYDDARSGGANMIEAAKAAGVMVVPFPVPITAQGTTLQGQQANIPAKILQPAFSLPQSGESDTIDLGNGEYAAVRIDKIMPAGLASLDEVRPAATQLMVLTEMQKKLQAKAADLTAQLKKGETVAQAAAAVGAMPQEAKGVRRDGDTKLWSPELVGKVFAAKPGEVVVGQDVKLGLVVARVDKVSSGAIPDLALMVETQRDGFRGVLFEDLTAEARQAAKDAIKPRVDYAKARSALGLEPLAAPKPAAKK